MFLFPPIPSLKEEESFRRKMYSLEVSSRSTVTWWPSNRESLPRIEAPQELAFDSLMKQDVVVRQTSDEQPITPPRPELAHPPFDVQLTNDILWIVVRCNSQSGNYPRHFFFIIFEKFIKRLRSARPISIISS